MGTASGHYTLLLKGLTVDREPQTVNPISRTAGRRLSISAFASKNWRCIPVQEFYENLRTERETKPSCRQETKGQLLVGIQSRREFKLNSISGIFDTICNENYSTPGSSNQVRSEFRWKSNRGSPKSYSIWKLVRIEFTVVLNAPDLVTLHHIEKQ